MIETKCDCELMKLIFQDEKLSLPGRVKALLRNNFCQAPDQMLKYVQKMGSWAILQLMLGKVAANSLQLFLVIVAAIFGQSCSIFWADLQLISYD